MAITPDDILKYCLDNFDGLVEINSWGERGIFYNPGGMLKRGVYVLTTKEKDGDNDRASRLDREDMWRVNIGVRKQTFRTLQNCHNARIKVVLWICRMTLPQKMLLCRIRSMRGWDGFAL